MTDAPSYPTIDDWRASFEDERRLRMEFGRQINDLQEANTRYLLRARAAEADARRAGAEAMREAAANQVFSGHFRADDALSEAKAAVRALPLPSAAEAASPADRGTGEVNRTNGLKTQAQPPAALTGPELADLIGNTMGEAIGLLDRVLARNRWLEAVSPAAGWRPTHLHYKGGYYRLMTAALREFDLCPMVVYEGENGKRWVRTAEDFSAPVGDAGAARFNPLDEMGVEAWQSLRRPPPSPPTTERAKP